MIYHYLPLLTDMLALQGASRELQDVGKRCIQARFDNIVKPFVGRHLAGFRFVLHTTAAVINGSCAMHMLQYDGDCPKNLNIIVPANRSLALVGFIIDTLHYDRIPHIQTNCSYMKVVGSHSEFRRGPWKITVSEAWTGTSIFNVIMTSRTTADMTVMTAGGLTAFYPLWTARHIAVMNHSDLRHTPAQNLGCIKRQDWEVYTSTSFMDAPCGSLCPTLWRNVSDVGQNMLVTEWDHRFPMKRLLHHSNTIWRLSGACANVACPFNTVTNPRACRLPPIPMPHDSLSIERQKQRINQHIPVRCLNHSFHPL